MVRQATQWSRTTIAATVVAVYSFLLMNGLSAAQEWLLGRGEWLPEGQTADVGIVLGYNLRRDGTPTAPLRLRVDAMLSLFAEGRICQVIFSGGQPGGNIAAVSEAEAMWRYAQQAAIAGGFSAPPRDRVTLEETSFSTRTNAINSVQLAAARRWKSAVIVTNPFHQYRAWRAFRCAAKDLPAGQELQVWLAKAGADVAAANQGPLYALRLQFDVYREFAAIVYYWARGWLC